MRDSKITVPFIQYAIKRRMGYRFDDFVPNCFIHKGYESDIVLVTKSGMITEIEIKQAVVDKGYRGHKLGSKISIVPRNKKRANRSLQKWWRRRSAIEPIIGHQKSEHRLDRNRLGGILGDQMNPILSACGFNVKKLMKAFWLYIKMAFQGVFNDRFMLSEN